jgi:hypothetical protein
MSVSSSIEWTDASWNPVRGCTEVSPGCARCYARTFAERFRLDRCNRSGCGRLENSAGSPLCLSSSNNGAAYVRARPVGYSMVEPTKSSHAALRRQRHH